MELLYKLIFFWLLIFYNLETISAPMSYKGSNTVMLDLNKHYKKIDANYAITAKDSVGMKIYEAKGEGRKLKGEEFYYLKLLNRINDVQSQSNLWLFIGAGMIDIKQNNINENRMYFSPTLQADFETRRIYIMASYQLKRISNENYDTGKFQGGFSFYETSFEETQPWFILKFNYMKNIDEKIEIIPTLRLINKNLYFEAGLSTQGNPNIHIMHTF